MFYIEYPYLHKKFQNYNNGVYFSLPRIFRRMSTYQKMNLD